MTTIDALSIHTIATTTEANSAARMMAEIMAEVMGDGLDTDTAEVDDNPAEVEIDVRTTADILCALLDGTEVTDIRTRVNLGMVATVFRTSGGKRHAIEVFKHEDGAIHVSGPANLIACFNADEE